MTNISSSYSPKRAAQLSGFKSVAMLDYLQRSGVFFPRGRQGARGRGRHREYEFRDILTLKAIKKLLDSGASVAALKKALKGFQKHTWSADPATLEDRTGIIRYLIADTNNIYLVRDLNQIINLTNMGQLTFSFILDLDYLHEELCKSIGLPRLQQELEL